MPRTSERKSLLKDLEKAIAISSLDAREISSDSESSDSCMDTEEDALAEIYAAVSFHRYLKPRTPVPKCCRWLIEVLPELDDVRFRAFVRVSRVKFRDILRQIENDPVFSNASRHNQTAVSIQLACALQRFGGYGNGVSYIQLGQKFSVSEGSVDNFTERVIAALLNLKKRHIRWPTREEKERHKRKVLKEFDFPNCVGIMDGSHFNLDYKPVNQGEAYYSRKSRYGITSMIVCTIDYRIIYASTGRPASTHDTRVWRNSHLFNHIEQYLDEEEYLLADSGYPLSRHVIIPYKKPHTNKQRNRAFNKHLSQVRIKVEHCIGILKGRWQSLRGLRRLLLKPEHHKKAVQWCDVCMVLHNMTLDDGWVEEASLSEDEMDDSEVEEAQIEDITDSAGQRRRKDLQRFVSRRK